jgi:hypothetical protein
MQQGFAPLATSIWNSHFRSSQMTGPAVHGFWSLSTNEGFNLHFCETGVLAIPASWKDSVKLGALAAAGQMHQIAGLLGASPPSETATPITDTGDKTWLRFPLERIHSIVCRRNRFIGRHKVVISMFDGTPTTFGLYVATDFELIADTLRSMYGGHRVREE